MLPGGIQSSSRHESLGGRLVASYMEHETKGPVGKTANILQEPTTALFLPG